MSNIKMHPVVKWIDYRLPIFTFLDHELHEYPTPKNLNYFWNFGSLAGIILVIMMVSGIVLERWRPCSHWGLNRVEPFVTLCPILWA